MQGARASRDTNLVWGIANANCQCSANPPPKGLQKPQAGERRNLREPLLSPITANAQPQPDCLETNIG